MNQKKPSSSLGAASQKKEGWGTQVKGMEEAWGKRSRAKTKQCLQHKTNRLDWSWLNDRLVQSSLILFLKIFQVFLLLKLQCYTIDQAQLLQCFGIKLDIIIPKVWILIPRSSLAPKVLVLDPNWLKGPENIQKLYQQS